MACLYRTTTDPYRICETTTNGSTLPSEMNPYHHQTGWGISEIVAHQTWSSILKTVDPKHYEMCKKVLELNKNVLDTKTLKKLMKCCASSPVVAAFTQARCGHNTLELDVYLPTDCTSPHKAKVAHGDLSTIVKSRIGFDNWAMSDLKNAYTVTEWIEKYQQALLKINKVHSAWKKYQQALLKYQELPEIEKVHSAWEKYQQKLLEIQKASPEIEKVHSAWKQEECSCVTSISLCLDIKTAGSTPEQINRFQKKLETDEKISKMITAEVKFVGSFYPKQLSKVPFKKRALFSHGIGGVLGIKPDTYKGRLFFNFADVLMTDKKGKKTTVDEKAMTTLLQWKKKHPDIQLGCYVQEADLASETAQTILKTLALKTYAQLLSAGFAFGGPTKAWMPRMMTGRGVGSQKFLLFNHIKNNICFRIQQVFWAIITIPEKLLVATLLAIIPLPRPVQKKSIGEMMKENWDERVNR